jgi:hypothetical protein
MVRLTWVGRGLSLVAFACALQACGGGDGDGPSGGAAGLLSQAPHCPAGTDALRIEGTVDGATVNDQRTASDQINAGYSNFTMPTFDSPLTDIVPLPASQLELHFGWAQSLAFGQTDTIEAGTLVAPSGAAHAGQTLCITGGQVGFVDGGAEDGVFKFRVSALRAGADCTGEVVPVELRGCYE